MCRLANNGRGMNPSDMVMTIGNCLKKGRKLTYDNILREATDDGTLEVDAWSIYQKIKGKIIQHTETLREKQLRVRNEWSELNRYPNESLLEFEARWDDKLKKMTRAGLDRTKDEMLIDYLNKVGENYSRLIRYDRREYSDRRGPRHPESWEEAHLIAFEIEKHSRDSDAIRREAGGSRQRAVSMSGGLVESENGHPQGNLMVPGLLGAAGEVPPPPAPYYDPDFESNFP